MEDLFTYLSRQGVMRSTQTTRRRFAFWIGLGLFQLGEKLSADGLDQHAAATMDSTESASEASTTTEAEHWSVAENRTWRWFQRENLVNGHWKVTGITNPVHKKTAQVYRDETGYLDESLVPRSVGKRAPRASAPAVVSLSEERPGQPDPIRKAHHGRPPSRWLRRLRAGEIRLWLRKITVSEAGVEGMSYFTHLTRDHYFEADRIRGLSVAEQAKLHAAAHAGY
jgi:hypothetical protein